MSQTEEVQYQFRFYKFLKFSCFITSVQRKHKTLSVSDKVEIIKEVKKNNRKKEDSLTRLEFHQAVYQQLKKNKNCILHKNILLLWTARGKEGLSMPMLINACLKSVETVKSVAGTRSSKKRQLFAEALRHNEFKVSNRWLEKFKYGIKLRLTKPQYIVTIYVNRSKENN